jgi:hypothetical protein
MGVHPPIAQLPARQSLPSWQAVRAPPGAQPPFVQDLLQQSPSVAHADPERVQHFVSYP